jgi:hypothetical protein
MMDKFTVTKRSEGVPLQEPSPSFSRSVIETAIKETTKKQKKKSNIFIVSGKGNMLW